MSTTSGGGGTAPDGVPHQYPSGPYGAPPNGYGEPPSGYGTPQPYPVPGQAEPWDHGAAPAAHPGELGYAPVAPPSNRRGLGWAGVVVLYLVALWQLVIPTISTFVTSLNGGNQVFGDGEWVGLANWSATAGTVLPGMALMVLVVLPVTLLSAVLGLAIGGGMTTHHRYAVPARIMVGVLGALFVPLGVAIAQFMANGLGESESKSLLLLIVTVTLAGLPLLTAGFATAFAAVLSARSPGRGVGIVLLVGITGALALGPQLFDIPYVLAYGGLGQAQPPMSTMVRSGFMLFDFGTGAAVGSMVLLAAGVFGIVAMLGLLSLRSRFVVADDGPAGPVRSGPLGMILAIVVLAGALVLVGPFLLGSLGAGAVPGVEPVAVALRTWLPVALGTLAQIVVAVIGGAAIGWCRPLGRRSLWLLLPLAPWLFVGPAPLMVSTFSTASSLNLLNSWVALVPGPGVVVGAVVVLALLFAGWQDRPTPRVRTATGAAVLGLAGVLLLTQAQSILPGYALASSPDMMTAPSAVMLLVGQMGYGSTGGDPLGLLYPIPMFIVVAALGVLAQLGLRRVVAVQE